MHPPIKMCIIGGVLDTRDARIDCDPDQGHNSQSSRGVPIREDDCDPEAEGVIREDRDTRGFVTLL